MKKSIEQQETCLLKALANCKRLQILDLLKDGEYKVGELEKIISLSQSSLSQHLAILRSVGIVSVRRQAQSVYYSLKNDNVLRILALLRKNHNA